MSREGVECPEKLVKSSIRVVSWVSDLIATINEIYHHRNRYTPSRTRIPGLGTLSKRNKEILLASDQPKNTAPALNALIRSSNSIPLHVFILQFPPITDVLVTKGLLSPVNRVVLLLEGLDEKMRMKVI
jgi:hypothetical protein